MQGFPNELLLHIYEYALSRTMCLVCRRWHSAVHLSHICGDRLPSRSEIVRFHTFGAQPRSAKFRISHVLGSGVPCFLQEFVGAFPDLPQLTLVLEHHRVDSKIIDLVGRLSGLTSLDLNLNDNAIGDHPFPFFSGLATLTNLTSLSLKLIQNSLANGHVQVLPLTFPKLSHLVLNLAYNSLDNDGVEAVCQSVSSLEPNLKHLVLDFCGNRIGFGAMDHLSHFIRSTSLSSLRLVLKGLQMSPLEVNHLLTGAEQGDVVGLVSGSLQSLTLDFDHDVLEDAGIVYLAAIGCHKDLTHLCIHLENNRISPEGFDFLGSVFTPFVHLKMLHLHLWNNFVGDDGLIRFCNQVSALEQLEKLSIDLSANNIGPKGTEGLVLLIQTHPLLTSLELQLRNNTIGNLGARQLALLAANCSGLRHLVLGLQNNGIGTLGVKALGDNLLKASSLQRLTLELDSNRVGDAGAESLCGVLEWLQLNPVTVSLLQNPLSAQGVAALEAAVARRRERLAQSPTQKKGVDSCNCFMKYDEELARQAVGSFWKQNCSCM